MNNKVFESIILKKKKCYFISPHYDDAVLSAGAVMTYLAKTNDIYVINIFTEAGKHPYTLSAKAYLNQCGYENAEDLYKDRKTEDREVLGKIVKESVDLGFTDALWRKKTHTNSFGRFLTEFDHIYPTYKFHIQKGKLHKEDQETVHAISKRLREIVDTKNSIIFCPMGIGNHVDHVMVHTICNDIFENTIFWSDFPYNQTQGSKKNKISLNTFTFSEFLADKKRLIEGYKTQFKAMFKQGLITKPEIYYTSLNTKTV